ncbi:hypothetical protein B0H13DRAFT_2302750 [Mycena leptocephala]|nr:hypothetical protein B0H13DRAFT_2302750 [Mycena leptocephala]
MLPYASADPPNVHEILTLLLPARGLIRFDYICNTSLSPRFESPDAQLLDSPSLAVNSPAANSFGFLRDV